MQDHLDAGGVLVSPCDSTPSEPCDATADELDVAIALDTLREATTLPARSVRRAWAGLRTFSRDEVPVVGEEPAAPGFWWLVGQGGGGIKTAPALAAIMAAAILGPKFAVAGSNHVTDPVDPALLSPARLR